jgi:phage terminase large subunit
MPSTPPTRVGANLEFPAWSECLFRPSRYKIIRGGRGSGKSWAVARALNLLAAERKLRILCTREFQLSIAESCHELLSSQIGKMGLGHKFEILTQSIRGANGSEFLFVGVGTNPEKVMSMEGVDIVWCEQGERMSERSWQILIPTIRQPGSEIWVTFNPDEENDPTYRRFVLSPPPDSISLKIDWQMNPWFPVELARERSYLARVDPEAEAHVWGGECRRNASAQILRGKYIIEEFTPPKRDEVADEDMWQGPYHGADHGFANDPAVFARLWIDSKHHRLMIEYEAWALQCELDDLPALARTIPDIEKYVIRADPSRPETISHLASKGQLRIQAAEAWKGSVEDGIAFLRSFEQIVIHPRCTHHIEEFRLYSYKRDRLTGDVLPEVVDKHNHCIDTDRYALEPMIGHNDPLWVWSHL